VYFLCVLTGVHVATRLGCQGCVHVFLTTQAADNHQCLAQLINKIKNSHAVMDTLLPKLRPLYAAVAAAVAAGAVSCQHGAVECDLNKVLSCAIALNPRQVCTAGFRINPGPFHAEGLWTLRKYQILCTTAGWAALN
jgi:hypothetical protein